MVARPFFMTLPGYPGRMDEKEILNDLEYLQQTYPCLLYTSDAADEL